MKLIGLAITVPFLCFNVEAFSPISSQPTKCQFGFSSASGLTGRRVPDNDLFQLHAKRKKSKGSPKGFAKIPEVKESVQDDGDAVGTQEAPREQPSSRRAAPEPESLNMGKKRLEMLQVEAQAKKDEELRALETLRETDAMLREDAGAATIPERVAMRMGKRMIPFVGVPLFGGMALFVGFWYFATYKDIQIQPVIVATSTIGLLVFGLLGITYSMMSSSWDEDRAGSTLGLEELSKNFGNIKEGLGRSRENAIIRDKARQLSDEEIKAALADLKKREEKERRKRLSLQEKLQEELE